MSPQPTPPRRRRRLPALLATLAVAGAGLAWAGPAQADVDLSGGATGVVPAVGLKDEMCPREIDEDGEPGAFVNGAKIYWPGGTYYDCDTGFFVI